MMYNNKLVASLKANGKILREFKDQVYVPFSSEYSLLLKNLNTVRVCVNVFIDGENQVPGGLVIDAGQEVDLERSIKNNNLNEGNRFRFIERTAGIEQHRGIKLEDGIVRIEFEFERETRNQWYINNHSTWNSTPTATPWYGTTCTNIGVSGIAGDRFGTPTSISSTQCMVNQMNVGGVLRGVDYSKNGGATGAAAQAAVNTYCADKGIAQEYHDGSTTMDCCFNDAGITVPGSHSTQKFSTVYSFNGDGTKHSIVLKLLGETPDNKPVVKPVTVKTKPRCVTCNRQNKATAKFCQECGTALEIFA